MKNEIDIAVKDGQIVLAEAVLKKLAEVSRMKHEVEAFELRVKDELKKAMEENGIKKFENELVAVTYVGPTTRKSVDTAMVKLLYPEVAKSCEKVSDVKPSVRISYK